MRSYFQQINYSFKTKSMKKYIVLAVMAICISTGIFAQQSSNQLVIESMMVMPKRGMEDKFEAAALAHDKKFHPEGNYLAGLRKIEYGPKAGWYVWVMGPVPYGSLDTRPTKESGHDQDWSATVDPTIETYGSTGFWNYNPDLSFGLDLFKKAKHYELWSVTLKPKQYHSFKELTGKLRKAYESIGNTSFLVLENNLHFKDGPDVCLIWSFNSYGDWQKDPGPKVAYEKLYGEGSWQNMLDDWMGMIEGYDSEIRSNIF